MTVVVSIVGSEDVAKEVVNDSMESNAASVSGDARDRHVGVVLG